MAAIQDVQYYRLFLGELIDDNHGLSIVRIIELMCSRSSPRSHLPDLQQLRKLVGRCGLHLKTANDDLSNQ